jgi:AbrB family looped-hinge helix DNA binding protein
MADEITIDASGRLVIPKPVRDRHRLSAGTRLVLVEEDDRLVLLPRRGDSVVEERDGILVFRGRLVGAVPDHRALREERFDRLVGRR